MLIRTLAFRIFIRSISKIVLILQRVRLWHHRGKLVVQLISQELGSPGIRVLFIPAVSDQLAGPHEPMEVRTDALAQPVGVEDSAEG